MVLENAFKFEELLISLGMFFFHIIGPEYEIFFYIYLILVLKCKIETDRKTIRSPLKEIANILWNQIIGHFKRNFCFIFVRMTVYAMTILLFQNLYIHHQE